MIANVAALNALMTKPKIDEINLKLLQDYYKTYLNPYRYTYELADGFVINLDFEEQSFCHLVGLESIVEGSIKERELKNYRGNLGYQNIMNGTVDFADLKGKNKRKFKDNKSKFVFFYLIPRILNAPNKVVYYKTVVNKIRCDLLIFDVHENAYVHLGIDKVDGITYAPRTFLIEPITNTSTGTKFIDPQDAPIAVINTTRTLGNGTPDATEVAAPTVSASSVTQLNNPNSSPPSSTPKPFSPAL